MELVRDHPGIPRFEIDLANIDRAIGIEQTPPAHGRGDAILRACPATLRRLHERIPIIR